MQQEMARQLCEQVGTELCEGVTKHGGTPPFDLEIYDDRGGGLIGAFTVTRNLETANWVLRPALTDSDFPIRIVVHAANGEWCSGWIRDAHGTWTKAA
jgi:hypothetical protein